VRVLSLLACTHVVAPSAVEVGVASYAVARHKRTHDEHSEPAPAPVSEQHSVVQRAVRHPQTHASQVSFTNAASLTVVARKRPQFHHSLHGQACDCWHFYEQKLLTSSILGHQ
jgi:hypothetical protein